MAFWELPIDASDPSYDVDVDLGDTVYRFNLAYNDRAAYWAISIGLPDGTWIVEGQPLRANWQPFRQFVDERLPAGRIFAVDTSGQGLDPTADDLGSRVLVIWDDGI